MYFRSIALVASVRSVLEIGFVAVALGDADRPFVVLRRR